MKIAEEYFGVSNKEYWDRYKEWCKREDFLEERTQKIIEHRMDWEKEKGHESIWPRIARVFGGQRLTEKKKKKK